MKVIRKSFIGVFFLLAASIWPVSSTHALMIELDLSDTTIEVGETFTMDVIANDVFGGLGPLGFLDGVFAFGFDVFISDPTAASVSGVTVGPAFLDDSGSFMDTDVAGSVFPALTDDTILLATLSFEALAAGALSVGISSDIAGLNEGLFYTFLLDAVDISTTRTDILVTSVPEPSTLMLLGIGLVGLGLMRRQKTNI